MQEMAHDKFEEGDRLLNLSELPSVPMVGELVGYWFAPNGTEVLAVNRYNGRYPEYYTHWITLRTNSGKTVVPFNDRSIQHPKQNV